MSNWSWLVVVLSLVGCQSAPSPVSPSQAGYRLLAVRAEDQRFVQSAIAGNLAEVTLGRVAVKHCVTPTCKAFARRMVKDHTEGLKAFQALAHALGVPLTAASCPGIQDLAEQLGRLKGKTFDKTYLTAMVDDHVEDVADFKAEAAKGTQPRVKALAASLLPRLESHLAEAKAARAAL
jgi:putative membrane protein